MHTLLRLALLAALLLTGLLLKGQNSVDAAAPKYVDSDMIATVMGDTLKVSIRKVDRKYVVFSLKGERMKQKLEKSEVAAILYKDGRIENFSNPIVAKKESEGASKIRVTYSEEDVQVYRQFAIVEGYYTGSLRQVYSNEFLQRMAIIDLKERAYKNDPRVKILLIKKVSFTRGYGDDPSATVVAEAYTR